MKFENTLTAIAAIGSAQTSDDLLMRFDRLMDDYGARDVSVGFFPKPDHISLHHTSAGSEAWRTASIERALLTSCPAVIHTLTQSAAATVEQLQAHPTAPRGREAVRVAQECGIRHGLVVPIHLTSGEKGGVAMLADRALEPDAVLLLTTAAILLHGRFEHLLGRVDHSVTLTPRERDVLAWFAEGKLAEDVAVIMGISQATVMFHARRAQMRLGTVNRTHTIAEAIRRRLIP